MIPGSWRSRSLFDPSRGWNHSSDQYRHLIRRLADGFQRTSVAERFPRFAQLPAVKNHLVRKDDPLVTGHYFHQTAFNFVCRRLLRKVQTSGNPQDVSINNYSLSFAKGAPKTTLAVLRATPGSMINSSMVLGTLPPNFSRIVRQAPWRLLALFL
jgi:hypothetical protein